MYMLTCSEWSNDVIRYEGAGIYRHSRLVRTAPLQITRDGLVARSTILWQNSSSAGAKAAGTAVSAKLTATATIANTGTTAAHAGAFVKFTLVDASTGRVVGSATTAAAVFPPISPGSNVTATREIEVLSPKLWAARSPTLYTVVAELHGGGGGGGNSVGGGGGGGVIDGVNVSHGFRVLTFSGADGEPSCTLNNRCVRMCCKNTTRTHDCYGTSNKQTNKQTNKLPNKRKKQLPPKPHNNTTRQAIQVVRFFC